MLTDEEWKRVKEWSGAERTARRNILSILFNAMKGYREAIAKERTARDGHHL